MTKNDGKLFFIAYDESNGLFKAMIRRDDKDVWVATEVERSLELLLKVCRERGLVLEGMTTEAIEIVYEWFTKDRIVLEYVEQMWEGSGTPSKQGPVTRAFGFRHTSDDVDRTR